MTRRQQRREAVRVALRRRREWRRTTLDERCARELEDAGFPKLAAFMRQGIGDAENRRIRREWRAVSVREARE